MDRRTFVASSTAILAASAIPSPRRHGRSFKVVLFDALAIFDTRPVAGLLAHYFPEQGSALLAAWRSRQFEYTWLRASGAQYRDFFLTTGDALDAATRALKLPLSASQRAELLDLFLHLPAWPDVAATLDRLAEARVAAGFLTNFTPQMLRSSLASARLSGRFDYLLSTDQVRTFKPAVAAYQLGLSATGMSKGEIAFAAFAGWDVAGSRWFGYSTVWVNRLAASAESLGTTADAEGTDLTVVTRYLGLS